MRCKCALDRWRVDQKDGCAPNCKNNFQCALKRDCFDSVQHGSRVTDLLANCVGPDSKVSNIITPSGSQCVNNTYTSLLGFPPVEDDPPARPGE